jgi:hypothetical protein
MDFEPVLEDWPFRVEHTAKACTHTQQSGGTSQGIRITSSEVVNVNVTEAHMDNVLGTLAAWKADWEGGSVTEDIKKRAENHSAGLYTAYSVRNRCGTRLCVKTLAADDTKKKDQGGARARNEDGAHYGAKGGGAKGGASAGAARGGDVKWMCMYVDAQECVPLLFHNDTLKRHTSDLMAHMKRAKRESSRHVLVTLETGGALHDDGANVQHLSGADGRTCTPSATCSRDDGACAKPDLAHMCAHASCVHGSPEECARANASRDVGSTIDTRASMSTSYIGNVAGGMRDGGLTGSSVLHTGSLTTDRTDSSLHGLNTNVSDSMYINVDRVGEIVALSTRSGGVVLAQVTRVEGSTTHVLTIESCLSLENTCHEAVDIRMYHDDGSVALATSLPPGGRADVSPDVYSTCGSTLIAMKPALSRGEWSEAFALSSDLDLVVRCVVPRANGAASAPGVDGGSKTDGSCESGGANKTSPANSRRTINKQGAAFHARAVAKVASVVTSKGLPVDRITVYIMPVFVISNLLPCELKFSFLLESDNVPVQKSWVAASGQDVAIHDIDLSCKVKGTIFARMSSCVYACVRACVRACVCAVMIFHILNGRVPHAQVSLGASLQGMEAGSEFVPIFCPDGSLPETFLTLYDEHRDTLRSLVPTISAC